MAVSLNEIGEWMGKHPYLTGGSIVIGGLGILWLLGYFDKAPAQSADSGQSQMAAAYYAAEATQAAAGAQIQGISLTTTAQTAQTKIAADAATTINAANTQRDITVNGQNTGSANTIAGYGADVAKTGIGASQTVNLAGISGQVQQTQINTAAATSQNASNNATAATVAGVGAGASEINTALQTIIPQEIAMSGGFGNFVLPGAGYATVNTGAYMTPQALAAQGYTPEQIAAQTAQQIQSGRFA